MTDKTLFETGPSKGEQFQVQLSANGRVYAQRRNTVTGLAEQVLYVNESGQAVDGSGISFLRGPMANGEWMMIPSIFRLRITGTGTVTIDSKDALGNITLAVHAATATAATDQIEFPYAGDNAVAIRATLTGTTTAEVI